MTKLQMRELRGSDTFRILRLINKVGVAEMVKDFFGKNKDSAEQVVELKGHLTKKPTKKELEEAEGLSAENVEFGLGLLEIAMEKLPLIESDLNAFLADLTDTDENTIANLPVAQYWQLIRDFFEKEELKSFLSSITSLMK